MWKRLAAVLAWLLLLCACGGKKEEQHTLVVDLGQIPAQMRDSLEAWKAAHPEISVLERKNISGTDLNSLAVIGVEHMPDIFITDGVTGRLLAFAGRALDLSGYAPPLPGLSYTGGAWAFQARREAVELVVFDPESTGIQDPGFLSAADLLNACFSDAEGQLWLQHIISNDGHAVFTDRFFLERFSWLQNKVHTRAFSSIEDFVTGQCSSLLVSGESLYSLLEQVKVQDPVRYARLQFRPFIGSAILWGYDTGIFVSAALAEKPEKLQTCISLCRALAHKPQEEAADKTLHRLQDLLDNAQHASVMTQYLSPMFWRYAKSHCLEELATSDKSPWEYAALLQDAYEKY